MTKDTNKIPPIGKYFFTQNRAFLRQHTSLKQSVVPFAEDVLVQVSLFQFLHTNLNAANINLVKFSPDL